ncbi:carbohydrate ABC transporter permease [Leifsonia poae]|uniref:carbohydrate ABC transporter permease n=1 Tax=Leifsonia poae TaxID=110933 RepID=UPI001CBF9676|nr:sugar ABC transporter permease [Leifsonia poae]
MAVTASVATGRAATAARPGRRSARRSDGIWPWLFLIPILVPLAIFFVWPLVRTVYYSFTSWGFFGDVSWVGLQNYARLFTDPDFALALGNTAIYTLIVLVNVPIAIWLAALMNRPALRFRSFYRTLYFLPVVTMPVAVAIVWRMLYSGDFGIINYVLSWFGVRGPYWLSTPGLSLVAVAVVGIWLSLGFNIIVFSAGLQSIPPDLYEAASIDGASPGRQFRSVTLPLLTPTIFFVTVLTLIGGFQVFDLIFVMLGTGPNAAHSQTLVYFFYNEGFLQNDKGYATAIGVVIIAMIAALTAIQFKVQKRWVHYE